MVLNTRMRCSILHFHRYSYQDYEGGITTLPPAETAPTPLRRRRLKMSEQVSDGE
jgi:hypothetical protein